ncbi:ABC transporter permease [Fulvivirgaceae bacterium BMA10]|uniref:ABC transporter permease n=1 Tax=Splendidivirga corallicola TaxID=3051826 RepID=A0ABT8KSL6_9BACT|nr:ABC transporter permease [Fulvivirgaceae bacterium BMA10]
MDNWLNLPWGEMLLVGTLLSGVVTVVLLLLNKYPASRFLGKLIAANLLFIIALVFQDEYSFIGLLALIGISITFFLYTQAFFIQNTRISLKHLLPIAIVGIVSMVPGIAAFPTLFRLLVTLLVLWYLRRSVSSVMREGKLRGIAWFQNPGGRFVWFRNFFGLNVLLVLYWLIAFESLLIEHLAVGVLVQLCFVYFQVFKESAFFTPLSPGNKYQKSTLTAHQKHAILHKLDWMLSNEKFYLQNDISLSKLATELNTTTHHLSQVLNESKGISFQELISKYRIQEAKLLLKDPDHKQTKIDNIAAMVGYYSKSAFNTAFKKYTGLTPTTFKTSKGVRSYREELLPDRKRSYSDNIFISSYHVLSTNLKDIMVNNFLKIFLRTLVRNKVFTAINLFGLIIGFTCSILIYLFIADELSYDKELPNNERIYRITWIDENPQTTTPHPMARAMVENMPEVEVATSISPWFGTGKEKQKVRMKNEEKNILLEADNFYFVDSTFLDVFELEVLAGDKHALKKPWNIVITDAIATKFFGDEDPIGKELLVNDGPMEVAAVIKEMPVNSHFHVQALVSYVTIKTIGPDNPWFGWGDFGHINYIKTKSGTDHLALEAKIPNLVLSYVNWSGQKIKALKNGSERFELQPVTEIHLNSHLQWELENNSNILYIYILTCTLVFILLIVSINYVNLTTAKSIERAKEIGVRKTLGAIPRNLRIQFYLESSAICFIALLLALGLSATVLDSFNYLTGRSFSVADIFNANFIVRVATLCFIISLVAGIYPAITFSSFTPRNVLKGKFVTSFQGNRLRSVLVVFQFFVSAILITGSLIILKQINFLKSKQLGFDQDAIISLRVPVSVIHGGIDVAQLGEMQKQFRSIAGVHSTSALSNLPGGHFDQSIIHSADDPEVKVEAYQLHVDFNINDVFGFEIVAGKSFNKKFSDDVEGRSFILNETAVRKLNLENPIGKRIIWKGDQRTIEGNIVGILKDFHYESLHQTIQPLIIQINQHATLHMVVKLEGQKFQQTLTAMEAIYKTFEKELPFEYHFLDEQLAELYTTEVRTLNIFSIFAVIALCLACLGLLGLAIAILNQQTKEVGIRKILGAGTLQISGMILGKFTRLIGLALMMGLPAGYLFMQRWIGEFAYQTSIGIEPFLVSIVTLLVIAIASVSIVVVRIAYTNPAEVLRYE